MQELSENTVEIFAVFSSISSNRTGTTVMLRFLWWQYIKAGNSDLFNPIIIVGLCDIIKLSPFINGHARRAILTIVNHPSPLVKSTIAYNQCCLRFHRHRPTVSNSFSKLFGLHFYDCLNVLVYFSNMLLEFYVSTIECLPEIAPSFNFVLE